MRNYTEEELLQGCLSGNKSCQYALYNQYSPKMYGICLRYARREEEASDILQEGFIKIFRHLKDFKSSGSLEGWIRRTIINTAINYYRQTLKFQSHVDVEQVDIQMGGMDDTSDIINAKELQKIISQLPDGYRMVFNLNAIEGFTHKEIGVMLDISENTSKSQLSRARALIQKRMSKEYAIF